MYGQSVLLSPVYCYHMFLYSFYYEDLTPWSGSDDTSDFYAYGIELEDSEFYGCYFPADYGEEDFKY